MKRLLLITGLLLLFGAEILRVYFIMPFPGSQHKNTIALAYWITTHIIWIRILAFILLISPVIQTFRTGKAWKKVFLSLILIFYGVVFFYFNYRFEADRMFYQVRQKLFVPAANDTTSRNKLVIGVVFDGVAKAYPIQIIGYHHQVMDTVGHTPVMVTYCTVCRTGRAFSPIVNGRKELFRLVGMDHFNAMFEDATTKSWWQQATGKAIAGPLKGSALQELPSRQLTLEAWLREYPNSSILQPDTSFKKDYDDLAEYDKGTVKSGLERRDSASWKKKSWVVGVVYHGWSKAYDWNDLVKNTVIDDSIGGLPVVLVVEKDSASFHVYDRRAGGQTLSFQKDKGGMTIDQNTHSTWDMDGNCVLGTLKGEKLVPVQAYQEFWHSWSTFHPHTAKFN